MRGRRRVLRGRARQPEARIHERQVVLDAIDPGFRTRAQTLVNEMAQGARAATETVWCAENVVRSLAPLGARFFNAERSGRRCLLAQGQRFTQLSTQAW